MASEALEPAFMHLIGEHFRRLTEAQENGGDVEQVCLNWWLCMEGLSWIVCTLRTDTMKSDYIHVSLAISKAKQQVASLIEDAIGYNPITRRRPEWELKAV